MKTLFKNSNVIFGVSMTALGILGIAITMMFITVRDINSFHVWLELLVTNAILFMVYLMIVTTVNIHEIKQAVHDTKELLK